MKNIDTNIEIVRPEEVQEQVQKMDKERYSDILKRINSQLESARDSGSKSKVLACVDVNTLEVDTSIIKDIVTSIREVGWKVGTKRVPFSHVAVFRVPDSDRVYQDNEFRRSHGIRISVYHPSVSDWVISNVKEYKHDKKEQEGE